jgi:hypothetical protein
LDRLEELDTRGVDQKEPEHWATRYLLEAKLDNIYLKEECYWQQISRERWVTIDNANTRFFHSCANGARRKTKICSLETDEGPVTSQADISEHIVKFYKNLFGSSAHHGVHLVAGFWPVTEMLSESHRKLLEQPFSKKKCA